MPAVLNHPSFIQPTHADIGLWRYMDLSKFVALLQRRALVFGRADCLGDPFEGSVPELNIRAPEFIRAIRKADPAKDPYKGISDDKLESIFLQLSLGRRQALRRHYISCWHMNEGESAAMWKLYSRSSDAVCIRTEYSALASLLPDYVYMGVVSYVDYHRHMMPADNVFNPFLIKRLSFSHEREARAIISDEREPSICLKEIPIELERLVKRIYVSPESPGWFYDVVKNLSSNYGLIVPVQHSEINATPLY